LTAFEHTRHDTSIISFTINQLHHHTTLAGSGTLVASYSIHQSMGNTMRSEKSIVPGRTTMKSSTRDKAEGTLHEVKGTLKEAIGKLTDNPKLQAKGTVEKLAGQIQGKAGQVKQVFGK
jgi:uncharacterized protein YjbJ (UPF0337 family)